MEKKKTNFDTVWHHEIKSVLCVSVEGFNLEPLLWVMSLYGGVCEYVHGVNSKMAVWTWLSTASLRLRRRLLEKSDRNVRSDANSSI